MMTTLQENWQKILENVEISAQKSGRKAEDITIIAVTKTIPPDQIKEALALGITQLGENKAQELTAKHGLFTPEPTWHMIGHLQTNKVKSIIDKVVMIQSVDSVHLAAEIDKRAKMLGKTMDILIEINIASEDTKNGIDLDQLELFIEQIDRFTNICIKGLMCVAPFVKNPYENRLVYEKMYKTFVDRRNNLTHNTDMHFLSMGMTNDYQVAIEEGANMIRLGTALFGSRSYT